MTSLIKQSTTSVALRFFMVDSTDHITGKTGLTPTVKIGKNGGTGAAPSGAISEIDATNLPGWYKIAGNATDTNTLGPIDIHASATGADPCDVMDAALVVSFDPYDSAALGLSRIDTNVNSRMATFTLPANFSSLSISAAGLVDILQTSADKVWNSTTRTLTALGSSLVAEIWNALLSTITTASSIGKLLKDNITGVLMLGSSYTAPPSAAANAAANWDEALSGHTTPGSAGATLSSAGSAGDPWSTALPGSYAVGTAGKILGTNLDATVSSRSQPGDIMKVSTGSGANQLDVTNGVVKANLAQILGTTLTETAGQIAAAFKKFYDIASPTSTINRITLVDTVSTLTNAPSDSSGVTALLAKFTGMTSLAQWLGAAFGKQTPNATAQTEIRATGAGAGTFDATTDSQEALRDRGDAAWITGPAPLDAAGTRTALGMASANLDTQLAGKAQPGDAMALVVNALDAAAVAPSGAAEIAAAGGTPQTGDVYGLLTSAQAEPTAVPAANATPMQKWAFMFAALRNKRTTTATQDKVLADDGVTTIATAPLADDGTTFARGEYV